MELTIHCENYQCPGTGEVVMLKPCGPIDQKSVQIFESKVLEYYRKGVCRLILDLCETKYLNSTGLGLLINIAHRVNVVGGGVRLVHVAEKFRVLFDMLGLESCLPIFSDVESALKSFECQEPQIKEIVEKPSITVQPQKKLKVEDIKIEEPESNFFLQDKETPEEELQDELKSRQKTAQNMRHLTKSSVHTEEPEEIRKDVALDSFFLDQESDQDIPVDKEAFASPQLPLKNIQEEEEYPNDETVVSPQLPLNNQQEDDDENSFRTFFENEIFQEKPIESEKKDLPEAPQADEDTPKTISRFVPSKPMTKKPLLKKTLGMMKEDLKKKNNTQKPQDNIDKELDGSLEEKKDAPEDNFIQEMSIETKIRQDAFPLKEIEEISQKIEILEKVEKPEPSAKQQDVSEAIQKPAEEEKEKYIVSENIEPLEKADLPKPKRAKKIDPGIPIHTANLWYYNKMKKWKTYPLAVFFNGTSAHEQKNVSNMLVVPHFPGCQVVPDKLYVKISKEKSIGRFWITPYTTSCTEKNIPAWIDIYYQGNSIFKFLSPFKIVHSMYFYFALFLALVLPCVCCLVNLYFPDALNMWSEGKNFIDSIGGWKYLALSLSGLFFLVALLLFLKTSETKAMIERKDHSI
ncbi:MAG: STAS domain-containing protein [Candidatus Brocadiae bacterium]|nr:STAS domain-containing protein [Candidatus Brocadiia bacterium]